MDKPIQLVVFILDEQQYALHLTAVERVVRAIYVTPLPKAPDIILGIVNLRGRIVPVVNVRQRFRLPAREMSPSDQLIIANTSRRTVALVADAVGDVLERPVPAVITAETILPSMKYVKGVITLQDRMILIHDLDAFLAIEEEDTLDDAMKQT